VGLIINTQDFLYQCKKFIAGGLAVTEPLVIGSGGDFKAGYAKTKGEKGSSELAIAEDVKRIRKLAERFGKGLYGEFQCKGKAGKTRSMKYEIECYFKREEAGHVIYYTGHGDTNGDWHFTDGKITFDWISQAFKSYAPANANKYRKCILICDCCYSGKWADRASEIHDENMIVIAAAGSYGKAVDNIFSKVFTKLNINTKKEKNIRQSTDCCYYGHGGKICLEGVVFNPGLERT
jgi:hypothetical protein